jgi:hypothetical protein
MWKLVRGWQQHRKDEEAAATERIRRVCAKGSTARTTVYVVFMIDVYMHAYDYLLSQQLLLAA